jgi:putative sterol carrier protein
LSEAKVLKKPEGNNGIAPLLQSLGMKEKSSYPSPMEFARSIHAAPGEPVDVEGAVAAGQEKEKEKEKGLDLNSIVERAEAGQCDWKTCLQTILSQEAALEPETHGLYSVNLKDTKESLLVEINETGSKVVLAKEVEGEHKPDVSINISSSDLAGVLKGSLPPLQAYLTGRISTSGDVRKLMLFDKLSNRSHKPGATFNL